jgi:hypothetical protein
MIGRPFLVPSRLRPQMGLSFSPNTRSVRGRAGAGRSDRTLGGTCPDRTVDPPAEGSSGVSTQGSFYEVGDPLIVMGVPLLVMGTAVGAMLGFGAGLAPRHWRLVSPVNARCRDPWPRRVRPRSVVVPVGHGILRLAALNQRDIEGAPETPGTACGIRAHMPTSGDGLGAAWAAAADPSRPTADLRVLAWASESTG